MRRPHRALLPALYKNFAVTRRGLVIRGEPSFAACARCYRSLLAMHDAIQFAIGDLLNYMEHRYGEGYAQMADATGYRPGTLQNFKYVAGRIKTNGRHENLSFEHHAAIASVQDDEQREALLAQAEHEQLSSDDLRTRKYEQAASNGHVVLELDAQAYFCSECLARIESLTPRARRRALLALSRFTNGDVK